MPSKEQISKALGPRANMDGYKHGRQHIEDIPYSEVNEATFSEEMGAASMAQGRQNVDGKSGTIMGSTPKRVRGRQSP